MSASSYLIPARPPFRALLIAAIAALVGAGLLVAALALNWHALIALLGGVLLAAGVALCSAAIAAMRRRVVRLTLDHEGYQITGPQQRHRGTWAKVRRVTINDSGDRLTIHHDTSRTYLVFPGRDETLIADICDDIRGRLRAVNP